jgi:hypothetical protein
MNRYIRVKDLKDQLGTNGPRPFLYCRYCEREYSAHAGDYFMLPDSHVFKCAHCDEPMRLAIKSCKHKWVPL